MSGEKRNQLILLAVVVVLIAAIAFAGGRSCAPPQPAPLDPGGIDAGPGEAEIAARLDGAVQQGQERLAQIEHKFEEDIAAFDDGQREDYERLRQLDQDEAAVWLSRWVRSHRRDGGVQR